MAELNGYLVSDDVDPLIASVARSRYTNDTLFAKKYVASNIIFKVTVKCRNGNLVTTNVGKILLSVLPI